VLPADDDLRLCPRAAPAARRRRRLGARRAGLRLRSAPAPRLREELAAGRHGDDREAGRQRRPHQHQPRAAARRGSSPDTNGSARRRCPMPS
jgi:hypothetical protein